MLEDERIKVINFLQDFGCATLKQLQILYNKPNDNFKDILTGNFVSKKGDIFIHNNSELNMKMYYVDIKADSSNFIKDMIQFILLFLQKIILYTMLL